MMDKKETETESETETARKREHGGTSSKRQITQKKVLHTEFTIAVQIKRKISMSGQLKYD